MKKLYAIVGITIILTLLSAGFSLWLSTPPGQDSFIFHSNLLVSFLMAGPHIGAVIIFLFGMRGFTKRFKTSYVTLCAGVLLLALGFLQVPTFSILDQLSSPWITYGGIGLPFLLSLLFMYSGVRGFARLFGVNNFLTSFRWWATVAVLSPVVTMLLPHAYSKNPAQTQGLLAVETVLTVIVLWTLALTYMLHKRAGKLYVPVAAWLFVYVAIVSIPEIVYVVNILVKPDDNVLVNTGLLFSPYFISGLVLLRLALSFNRISDSADIEVAVSGQGFFGQSVRQREYTQRQTLPNVIVYTAGLVSDTQAIDPVLDDMRMITAGLQPGVSLNDEQQRKVAKVYLQLEDYLTSTEAVRVYSKETLRQRLQDEFGPVIAEYPVFWRELQGPSAPPPEARPAAARPLVPPRPPIAPAAPTAPVATA